MLDSTKIKKQVLRLSGLSFQPSSPEGWTELSKILQRRCLTIEHAERVIDRWLETEENVPKPVQLAALCGTVPADPEIDQPILAEPCDECGPEGLWRVVQKLNKYGPVECTVRCSCSRGRQLAALDAKRAEEDSRNRKQPGRLTQIDQAKREIS